MKVWLMWIAPLAASCIRTSALQSPEQLAEPEVEYLDGSSRPLEEVRAWARDGWDLTVAERTAMLAPGGPRAVTLPRLEDSSAVALGQGIAFVLGGPVGESPDAALTWLSRYETALDVRTRWLARERIGASAEWDRQRWDQERDVMLAALEYGGMPLRDLPSASASREPLVDALVGLADSLVPPAHDNQQATAAYGTLILAWAVATLGDGSAALEMQQRAADVLKAPDPIHASLLAVFERQIAWARAGMPLGLAAPEGPSAAAPLERFSAYKIERLLSRLPAVLGGPSVGDPFQNYVDDQGRSPPRTYSDRMASLALALEAAPSALEDLEQGPDQIWQAAAAGRPDLARLAARRLHSALSAPEVSSEDVIARVQSLSAAVPHLIRCGLDAEAVGLLDVALGRVGSVDEMPLVAAELGAARARAGVAADSHVVRLAYSVVADTNERVIFREQALRALVHLAPPELDKAVHYWANVAKLASVVAAEDRLSTNTHFNLTYLGVLGAVAEAHVERGWPLPANHREALAEEARVVRARVTSVR
ncbi:MAG: hypothetical protein KTR31_37010 [Myxococcales bacterium]|nr:hypothetical protein [Myxococcales bacterium]